MTYHSKNLCKFFFFRVLHYDWIIYFNLIGFIIFSIFVLLIIYRDLSRILFVIASDRRAGSRYAAYDRYFGNTVTFSDLSSLWKGNANSAMSEMDWQPGNTPARFMMNRFRAFSRRGRWCRLLRAERRRGRRRRSDQNYPPDGARKCLCAIQPNRRFTYLNLTEISSMLLSCCFS